MKIIFGIFILLLYYLMNLFLLMIISGTHPKINGLTIFLFFIIGGLPLITLPWLASKWLPIAEFNYSRLIGAVIMFGLIIYIYSDYIRGVWTSSIFYYLFHFLFILALFRINIKLKSN